MSPPPELDVALSHLGDRFGRYKGALRDYLSKIGWSPARITEAFRDITEAIKG